MVRVQDRKIATLKQIFREFFSRNEVPKTSVPDNAPKFYNESCIHR